MNEKKGKLSVILLAYPDNPVGTAFIKAFLRDKINITGVVTEIKPTGSHRNRIRRKIASDGLSETIRRMLQILWLKITGTTVTKLADKNAIPVYTVAKFNSRECETLLSSLHPDLLAIASAPILKEYIFNKGRLGCLNAHPGWLPTYRGLGANAHALEKGDLPGVSVHFIDEKIDRGRIILRERVPVNKRDTVARINDRAVARGAQLMALTIQTLEKGTLVYPQIPEPVGENYRSMAYTRVKRINRNLRKWEKPHEIRQNTAH